MKNNYTLLEKIYSLHLYKFLFLKFFYAVVKMYCFIYVKQNKKYVPTKNNENIKQKNGYISGKKNIMHSTIQYEQLRYNCMQISSIRIGLARKLVNTDTDISININLLF